MRLCRLLCWRMVMEKRTSIRRQTATTACIEAAVGPHSELPAGPTVANPPHRQEVGGAAGGPGPRAAGTSARRRFRRRWQQRVIAPGAGVAVVAGTLLGQSVGLADRRIQIDGEGASRVQRRPSRPSSNSRSPGPVGGRGGNCEYGWRAPCHTTQGAGCPAGAQHIGVVKVAARQRRCHQVIILSPVLARPGARPRSKCRSTSWGCTNVAGRISPALLTRRWSSKAMRMRSGWWRGTFLRMQSTFLPIQPAAIA